MIELLTADGKDAISFVIKMFNLRQSSRYGGLVLGADESDVKSKAVFSSSGEMCCDCAALTAFEQEEKSCRAELDHAQ